MTTPGELARPLLPVEGVCYRELMQRLFGLISLLALGGCFYLGDRNHAPEGKIELQQSSARLVLKGSVTLIARATDPDEHDLSYQWKVKVKRLIDGGTCYLSDRIGPDNCKGVQPRIAWSAEGAAGSQLALNNLPFRGQYTVELRVSDELGAERLVSQTFEVSNEAPKLKLLLDVDPDFSGMDRVPDINGSRPAHAHYMVRVSEKDLVDLEQDLLCGKKAKILWTVEYPTGPKMEYQNTKPCQGKQVLDRYRFRFAADSVSAPFTVTIKAEVDDGYQGKAEATLKVTLSPDRPPCILGVEDLTWDELKKAEVPVRHDKGLEFQAPFVSDDVAESLTFVWLASTGKDFQVISGRTVSSYTIPPWFGAPGEVIRLRVVVLDAGTTYPSCKDSEILCASHKPLPTNCYQWVTWKVKFK